MTGGDPQTIDRAAAASLLGWWLEAGVDVAVTESPRDWLKPVPPPEPQAKRSVTVTLPASPKSPSPDSIETLDAFHAWLGETTGLPLDRPGARRVLPVGVAGAPVMLLSDLPGAPEAAAGRAIAGEEWALAVRMMAAIGIEAEAAYVAALSCFHAPGARLGRDEIAACGLIARDQVRLAAPQRLILFGDAPARALTGQQLSEARGKVHRVEGVRTIATVHPRWLLQRPSDKALAWRDLMLLMSDAE